MQVEAGPSGLSIHTTVAVTIESTGNGQSTNGSSSDTPRKRQRQPESWKRTVAKTKRAKGEEYTSPSTGIKDSSGKENGARLQVQAQVLSKFY